jgi:hypothetical protein
MPSRVESLAALQRYHQRMEAAIKADQHHDQLRAILVELLRDGFALSVDEIELERNVKLAKVRGRIDLLYGATAWEVKRDLDRERDDLERELQLYLRAQGPGSFGIATDGLRFEAHRLDGQTLLRVDVFDMRDPATMAQALDWLDAYLFTVDDVQPTGDSIISRFGLDSPVHRTSASLLQGLWTQIAHTDAAQLKRAEWEKLLEVVYGAEVGTDDLWCRHAFLVLVARLMAYLATTGHLVPAGRELGIVTGELFESLGLENMVERDFFAWPAEPPIADATRDLIRALSSHLSRFALGGIDEDVLKDLYENLVDPVERQLLGEFYTPDWLADVVLERAGFDVGIRMLDPSCGSGTFLFAAIRRLRMAGLSGEELVERAASDLTGIDIHPVAITTARANFVLALRADLASATKALTIPVFMADTLAAPEQGFGRMVEIAAPVADLTSRPGEPPYPDRFQLPTERDPNQAASLADIVDLLEDLASSDYSPGNAQRALDVKLAEWGVVTWAGVWKENLRILQALYAANRDTIWSFVLANASRPHELARNPVDLIVGNPPWLTVMDIRAGDYRDRIRSLARRYGLVQRGDPIGHSSHVDTSTVFAAFCADHFLKLGGRLAFVLPRSVMAGAKQHEHFREGRAAIPYEPVEAIDLRQVEPLFRIPACVMIFERRTT